MKQGYEDQMANKEILGAHYPLQENDARFQQETQNPKGYVVQMGGKMPTIELSTAQEGAKEGTVDFSRPQGGYPNKLAESVDKVQPLDKNQRKQFIHP